MSTGGSSSVPSHPPSPSASAGNPGSELSGARPLSSRLREIAETWAQSQYLLVVLAADFADSDEWASAGSSTAAHWLARVADVEVSTAREWIRIGRKLRTLPAIAETFRTRAISYSKVRTLTRIATPDNERELLGLAVGVPAGELGRVLALWFTKNTTPEHLARHQAGQRSVRWRTEADGMISFTLRLEPFIAATLISLLTTLVLRSRAKPVAGREWPTVAQQYADAFSELLHGGVGEVVTEVVLHVRGDGSTLDDGTPIADSFVERLAPQSFIRALIHDAQGRPIDASNRRRRPTVRQKRVVKERDQSCVDCNRSDLLNYDHIPPYDQTRHTITSELQLRCAPCHHKRHRAGHES